MICNRELEKRLIAGLIQHPDTWQEISVWVNSDDFPSEGSRVNNTIFCMLRNALNNNEQIDEVIIAERVKNFGIKFEDNIDVTEYILGLKSLTSITHDQVMEVARELKKVSFCRQVEQTGLDLQKYIRTASSKNLDEIILESDKIYNSHVNIQSFSKNIPINICETMEEDVEFMGEHPIEENGFKCPYKRLGSTFGSLLKAGDISAVVARTAQGKTKFAMEYAVRTCQLHNYEIPILHFDNGEMSQRDIEMRLCSQLSGVSYYFISTGKFRRNEEMTRKIRDVWKYVKEIPFYYYQVGGMSPEQMVNELKKFYFTKVGRYNKETGEPNNLIFSFDYIKQIMGNEYKKQYEVVGEMVQRFKTCIQSDIVDDKGLPVIAMLTSVQSNRSGIVGNRKSDELIDDDGQVALSDQISQQVSYLFLLRNKTMDEIVNEPNFGTHKLIPLKTRFLGENNHRAQDLIKLPDGNLRRNCIHLNIDGFNVEEVGDTVDLLNVLDKKRNFESNNQNDEGVNL